MFKKLLLTLMFALSCGLQAENVSRKPNVIVLLVDDLGYMALGYMGNKDAQTPNIDQLASESMRFTKAYSSCTVCSPARAALMTGRNPAAIGITTLNQAIQTKDKFISEAVQQAGYKTVALGKWHITKTTGEQSCRPLNSGFDEEIAVNHKGQPATYYYPYKKNTRKEHSIFDLAHRQPKEHLSEVLGDEAGKWIRKNAANPFFMYMYFYGLHTPIQGRKDLVKKYQSLGKKNANFLALTESLDIGIGHILNALKETKLEENTVILFTGDNGGYKLYSNNGNLRSGKSSPYEGGVKTPMFVKWPGVTKAGSESSEMVITHDYAKTIAEITRVAWDKESEDGNGGYSLVSLLKNPQAKLERQALYWTYYPQYHRHEPGAQHAYRVPTQAVQYKDWKLVCFMESPLVQAKDELYNLMTDGSEQKNLLKSYPEKAQELAARLNRWTSSMPATKFDVKTYSQEAKKQSKRLKLMLESREK